MFEIQSQQKMKILADNVVNGYKALNQLSGVRLADLFALVLVITLIIWYAIRIYSKLTRQL